MTSTNYIVQVGFNRIASPSWRLWRNNPYCHMIIQSKSCEWSSIACYATKHKRSSSANNLSCSNPQNAIARLPHSLSANFCELVGIIVIASKPHKCCVLHFPGTGQLSFSALPIPGHVIFSVRMTQSGFYHISLPLLSTTPLFQWSPIQTLSL
jgi:hypothetical protein